MTSKNYARKRTLDIAFHVISKMIRELSLSSEISKKAEDIYLQAYEQKITLSRGIAVIATVSILIACRRSKIEIDFDKAVKASNRTANEIRLGYQATISKLFPDEIELGLT